MPLPLIPLIFGGVALATTAFGAYKGKQAHDAYQNAEALQSVGDAALAEATGELERAATHARERVAHLGELRLRAQATLMRDWVDVLQLVHGVEINEIATMHMPDVGTVQIQEIVAQSTIAVDLLQGTMGGVVAGMGATSGATGLVAGLGTASSGAAISSLSGAAATSATTAWFGGGSLAAGGLGVAGGTLVLGGLGVGVIATVAGMKAEAASQQALLQATQFHASRLTQAAEAKELSVLARSIASRADEVSSVILPLGEHLAAALATSGAMIRARHLQSRALRAAFDAETASFSKRNPLVRWWLRLLGRQPTPKADPVQFDNMSREDQNAVEVLAALGVALYPVLKIELLDEAGHLKPDVTRVVEHARRAAGQFERSANA